ncbi:MAG: 50S ribosomal protein L30e [Thermoplasmatales archaeon]|nr:50S ribosomal protein L30e [Thermoplasmatales archaeon]
MIEKELLRAVKTGKVLFGSKMVIKKIDDAKAVVISSDCVQKEKIMSFAKDKPVYIYNGNNLELGNVCGKPFGVSALAIIDEGKSGILSLIGIK